MTIRLCSGLVISAIYLIGCSQPAPEAPACRIASEQFDDVSANAACVIRLDSKLLVISHRLSNKFDVPGGTAESEEQAQCVAHRETWEETGFNVEVGGFLGQSQNGMRFYACTLAGNFTGKITQFPVPDWASMEVKGIELVDPYTLHYNQWRFPDELVSMRAMFDQVQDSKTIQPSIPEKVDIHANN